MPVPVLKTNVRAATPAPAPAPAPGADFQVQIALADLVAGLPESARHAVAAVPNQFVSIPVDHLLPQLGLGNVTLSVAELRVFAPNHFSSLSGHDQTAVALPLVEILRQIPPARYARRNQKRIEVPDEISALFSADGKGLSVSKPAATPTAAVRPQPTVTATTPPPAPAPAPVPVVAPSPAPAQQAGKISMSPTALAALAAMNNPATAQAPAPSKPVIRMTPKPTPPAPTPLPRQTSPSSPAPTANGNGNGNGAAHHGTNGSNGNGNGNGNGSHHPNATGAANGAPKLSGETLAIPLAALAPGWVQEVRAALAAVDMDQARILVPIELLEAAMKTGKVFFRWSELSAWIRPDLTDAPTGKLAETTLELPLKVIAPLFMARHRGAAQKKAAVDESIPDLFEGGSGSMKAQVPQRAGAEPMTAPARSITPAAPAPAPAPVAPGISLEQVIGPAAKRLTAREIVANTARLPGLSGAILVMSDGLLVTNATPAAVKAETIAAFVPQMFGRMNQYTKELALGALQHLTLGIEGGQWHFLKSGSLYLAVLGRPGETLPLNLLAQIAAELSSQSK